MHKTHSDIFLLLTMCIWVAGLGSTTSRSRASRAAEASGPSRPGRRHTGFFFGVLVAFGMCIVWSSLVDARDAGIQIVRPSGNSLAMCCNLNTNLACTVLYSANGHDHEVSTAGLRNEGCGVETKGRQLPLPRLRVALHASSPALTARPSRVNAPPTCTRMVARHVCRRRF